jgi:hypothetical protein
MNCVDCLSGGGNRPPHAPFDSNSSNIILCEEEEEEKKRAALPALGDICAVYRKERDVEGKQFCLPQRFLIQTKG